MSSPQDNVNLDYLDPSGPFLMSFPHTDHFFFFFNIFKFLFFERFYLFFRGRGKEGEKEGEETPMCERNIDWLPFVCSNRGPGLQPRPVP